jgi:hypothetical protein
MGNMMPMVTYVLRETEEGEPVLIEKHLAPPRDSYSRSVQVMSDIAPFKSIVDNTVVGSRSALREHNKRNQVIDIGNDPAIYRPRKPYEPQGVEIDVKRAFAEHGWSD